MSKRISELENMLKRLRDLERKSAEFDKSIEARTEQAISNRDDARRASDYYKRLEAHFLLVVEDLSTSEIVSSETTPSVGEHFERRAAETLKDELEKIRSDRLSGGRRTKLRIDKLAEAIASELARENDRREKIAKTKRGSKRPSPYAAAYAAADKIKQRNPKLSPAAVLLKLERDLPEGTDLPTERTLRRYLTGH